MNKADTPQRFTSERAVLSPMRKLLNNRWFVAALATMAVAMVWVSLRPATSMRNAHATAGDFAAAEEEALSAGEPATLSTRDALKQLSTPAAVRDPFAARVTASATPEKPAEPDFVDTARLFGIWTQNGETLLLINEHIRSVGDSIGRLKIESAGDQGIWLTHWQGRTYLAVGKSFVLKTPGRLASQATLP